MTTTEFDRYDWETELPIDPSRRFVLTIDPGLRGFAYVVQDATNVVAVGLLDPCKILERKFDQITEEEVCHFTADFVYHFLICKVLVKFKLRDIAVERQSELSTKMKCMQGGLITAFKLAYFAVPDAPAIDGSQDYQYLNKSALAAAYCVSASAVAKTFGLGSKNYRHKKNKTREKFSNDQPALYTRLKDKLSLKQLGDIADAYLIGRYVLHQDNKPPKKRKRSSKH